MCLESGGRGKLGVARTVHKARSSPKKPCKVHTTRPYLMGVWLDLSQLTKLDELVALTSLSRGDILRFGLSLAQRSLRLSWGHLEVYGERETKRWRAKVRKRTQQALGSSDPEGNAGQD